MLFTSCNDNGETKTDELNVEGYTDVIEFDYKGGNKTFQVKSNGNWTVTVPSADANWLSVNPESGSNDGSVTVSTKVDKGSVDKQSVITVSLGRLTHNIPIKQNGIEFYLTPSKTSVAFSADAEESPVTINIDTNLESWTATSEADWLTVTHGDVEIVVSATEYYGITDDRTGTVVIKSEDLNDDVIIPVTQDKLVLTLGNAYGIYELTGTPQGYDADAPTSWTGRIVYQGDTWNLVLRIMPSFDDTKGAWIDYLPNIPSFEIDNSTDITAFTGKTLRMSYCYKDGETLYLISNPLPAEWDYVNNILDYTATYEDKNVIIGLVDPVSKEVYGDLYANYKLTKTGDLPSGASTANWQYSNSKTGGTLTNPVKITKVENIEVIEIDQSKWSWGNK